MYHRQFTPFDLSETQGFISGNLVRETGFDDTDLKVLCKIILDMYEHDHTASKGEMAYGVQVRYALYP